MQRNAISTKDAIAVTSALLSIGIFAGAGTVEAYASGCSLGIGPTWTSSVCTTLNGGTKQRAVQWCATTGVGWQYGLTKSVSSATSATADCYGAISGRQQQIW